MAKVDGAYTRVQSEQVAELNETPAPRYPSTLEKIEDVEREHPEYDSGL